MTYIKPQVAVYQELANSGGSAAINPELPACIIGPLKNIVEINLEDAAKSAISLAASVTTFTGSATPNSPYTGQVIDQDSLEVVVSKSLVKTYRENVDFSVATPVLQFNDVGDTDNSASDVLPFKPGVRHVEVGDTVVISDDSADANPTVSFITSLNYTTGEFDTAAGISTLSASKRVTVYKAISEVAVPSPTWVNGSLTLDTLRATADSNTTDYTFSSELAVKGTGSKADVHIGYVADRKDLTVLTPISDITELGNVLGAITPDNPLAYGVYMALSNSGGATVYALPTDPALDETIAYTQAVERIEGSKVYALAPMTQNLSAATAVVSHAKAMSTPDVGKWRVAIVNVGIPDLLDIIGTSTSLVTGRVQAVNAGEATITITDGSTVGETSPSDVLVTSAMLAEEDMISAGFEVLDASQYTIFLDDPTTALSVGDVVEFKVIRASSKLDQVNYIVAQANAYRSNRAWVIPGNITVIADDVEKEVPGYFQAAAVAGYVSGVAPQVGMTRVALSGATNMVHSNFYFTDNQLNTMAAAGVTIFVQEAQGTTPYCRHALTTDVSTLEYREILKVKNWDYLSYYFAQIVDPFIGTWNINRDSIRTIRQTLDSAANRLTAKKLPKVGAPLVSYDITRVAQNAKSKDSLDVEISIAMGDPNNYTNLYLVV